MPDLSWRKLTAAAILVVGIAVVWSADADVVRFASVGNNHACSVNQLAELPDKVDAVFLGSSRVRRGISTEQFAEAMGEGINVAYNFGRPGREIHRSESIINHLLDSGQTPDIIVLEADTDLLRLEDDPKPFWRDREAGFLTYREIVEISYSADDPYGFQRTVQGIRHKFSQTLLRHLTGITFEVLGNRSTESETVCWRKNFDKQGRRAVQKQKKYTRELRKIYDDPATALDERMTETPSRSGQFEIAAINRIREKLEAVGSKLIVIRHMGYLEPPMSAAVLAKLNSYIPEFATPDEELSRELSDKFIDTSHLNPEGRALFTKWLAETLKSRDGLS